LFFGPLDDVTRDEDAYSPLQHESRYCAACHEGVVFGVHVYSTYSEWLESPAFRAGQSCQSCHLTPTGEMTNVAPGAGGVERDPSTLASHAFLPGGREAMLRRCLNVEVETTNPTDETTFRVTVTAMHVGHRVPTGFIDRHLMLVVEPEGPATFENAADQGADAPRSPLVNPCLPIATGDLSGKPGRLFSKLRTDDQGRPIPFWRNGADPLDTRLIPGESVMTEFRFPSSTNARVRLIYRPFWDDVAREKSWPDRDIVIYDEVWP
jgi:hypothetical protein